MRMSLAGDLLNRGLWIAMVIGLVVVILSTGARGSAVPNHPQSYLRSGQSRFGARSKFTAQNLATRTDREDMEILLQFKSRLTNGNELLAGWQSAHGNVCEWVGVTCGGRGTGRVTDLNLPFLGLHGDISPALGRLKFLVRLNLSYNYLYGALPASLGNLTHVQAILLSSNNITGDIPPEFGKLRALRFLDLGNNMLSGGIPLAISNCSSLVTVSFAQNLLEGFIPPELGLFTGLAGLDLSQNQLTGEIPLSIMINCTNLNFLSLWENQLGRREIPSEVGRLHMLESLDLSYNNFIGMLPVTLINCSNLVYLNLRDNKLEGDIPWEFGQLINLRFLDVEDTLLTNSLPQSLANCSRMEYFVVGSMDGPRPTFFRPFPQWIGAWGDLKSLSMEFMGLTGTIPPGLFNLSKLTDLSIEGNSISGSIPPEIGNVTQLSVLQIGYNQLLGEIPDSITRLSSLEDVDLAHNYFQGFFPLFKGNYSSLEGLELGTNNFRGTLPSELDNRFPNLVHLGLSGNHFEGNLPSSLGNLSRLERLVLPKNRFQGPIPSSLGNLTSLGVLYVDFNHFTGAFPTQIFLGCPQLSSLTIRFNDMNGPLVEEIGELKQLNYLDISGNEFSGPIPSSLGDMVALIWINMALNNFSGNLAAKFLPSNVVSANLSHNNLQGTLAGLSYLQQIEDLDLSANLFSGSIPGDISECKEIEELDLSSNNFTGVIPTSLDQLNHLKTLNFSNNNLEGSIPTTGVFSTLNLTSSSFDGNPRLCGIVLKRECPSATHASNTRDVLIGYIVGAYCSALLIGLWISRCWKPSISNRNPDLIPTGDLQQFSAETLREATNGFSEESLIGEGAGAKVYKATLGEGLLLVAKVFRGLSGDAAPFDEALAKKKFLREIGSLSELRHRNVLRLVGYCSEESLKAVILEFMSEGSLHSHLHEKMSILSLKERLKIIQGITNGLIYLHDEFPQPIIHRDLSPTNILLDTNMVPKISDFTSAKFVHDHISSDCGSGEVSSTAAVRGTIGYIPPEYSSCTTISTRGDVYAFGIIIMELITRRRPFDNNEHLVSWISNAYSNGDDLQRIADGSMLEELEDSNNLRRVDLLIKVAFLCSKPLPRDRPHMKEVKEMLHYIGELGTEGDIYPSVSQLVNESYTLD